MELSENQQQFNETPIKQSNEEQMSIDYNISQFLDLNSVYHFGLSLNNYQESTRMDASAQLSSDSTHQFPQEIPVRKQELSVFHNFQKHLITLFKKNITIGEKNLRGRQHKPTILALWKAFKKYKAANKKILHMLFGMISTTTLEQQLKYLASKSKEFESLKNQHSLEAIKSAQLTIKREVINQTQKINREFLKQHCSVTRLDHFWEYYSNFMTELREGVVMKRLLKKQKKIVLRRILQREQMSFDLNIS